MSHTVKKQATDWAFNLAKIHFEYCGKFVHGAVFIYHVNYNVLNELSGEVLMHNDENWAEFIANNRTRTILGIHNNDNKFDFVYGSLADGNTSYESFRFKSGEITFDEYKSKISPSRAMGNQLSFHTKAAVDSLKLKNKILVQMTRRMQHVYY